MKTYTLEDFKRWGSKGGKKSRRKLSRKQAQEMVRAREANRHITTGPTRQLVAQHQEMLKHTKLG